MVLHKLAGISSWPKGVIMSRLSFIDRAFT